jgi:hypothetical protein
MQNQTFVTMSRRGDLILFFFLLACMLVLTSYRLRVYFQITVLEVSVTRFAPSGVKEVLPTPRQFQRMPIAVNPPQVVLEMLERRIREYMYSSSLLSKAEPGTRFEWQIHYALNSVRLDKHRVLVFKSDGVN